MLNSGSCAKIVIARGAYDVIEARDVLQGCRASFGNNSVRRIGLDTHICFDDDESWFTSEIMRRQGAVGRRAIVTLFAQFAAGVC